MRIDRLSEESMRSIISAVVGTFVLFCCQFVCAHLREPVYDANSICQTAKTSRNSHQQKLCRQEPEIVREISSGVAMAVAECQARLKSARWNCSVERGSFKKIMETATRESGFVRAIISAGIVQSLATGCADGRLLVCSCGGMERQTEDTVPDDDQWVWGGCNDADDFAQTKSEEFIDDVSTKNVTSPGRQDFRMMIYRHNNEAGRLATRRYKRRVCKCHGLSGSCCLQTCWLRLPSFSEVGQRLKDRYDGAVEVTIGHRQGTVIMTPAAGGNIKHQEQEDIVFSNPSPSYCNANKKEGVLGTRGRDCDPTALGVESCNILCCGRGYRTRTVRVISNCRCKFRWCCDVVCETCQNKTVVYRCK